MTALDYLTAREAAALLGVGRATLYAYVSRGLVRSEPFGGGRQKRYLRGDIDRLIRRRQGGESEADTPGSADAMAWPSAITLIADGRLSYRGHDAVALSDGLSLEETARLLWQAGDPDPFAGTAHVPVELPPDVAALPPLSRLIASLPLAEALDPQAVNHSRQGCARTGARLLGLALDVMVPAAGGSPHRDIMIHEVLARRWQARPDGADLLRRCLVLCADHEFNASAFVARCIAGTGASVYAALAGALAALRGPRHGGAAARVAAMLDSLPAAGSSQSDASQGDESQGDRGTSRAEGSVAEAVAARLARGEDLPGFGHPLYPDRDPRAVAILRALAAHAPDNPERRHLDRIVVAAARLSDRHPNLDFALVAVARVLDLPLDAPLILFALGRTVGWVAHAEEQYRDGRLVRPRSIYTGPLPK